MDFEIFFFFAPKQTDHLVPDFEAPPVDPVRGHPLIRSIIVSRPRTYWHQIGMQNVNQVTIFSKGQRHEENTANDRPLITCTPLHAGTHTHQRSVDEAQSSCSRWLSIFLAGEGLCFFFFSYHCLS